MKTFTKLLLALQAMAATEGAAQHIFKSDNILGYQLNLYNITFDPGKTDSYPIALSRYGLKQHNYSILIKAKIEGDTNLYSLPGILASGDAFGFKIKAGTHSSSDTVTVYRRAGDQPLTFQQIRIFIFRQKSRRGIIKENDEFTRFIVSNFVAPATHLALHDY